MRTTTRWLFVSSLNKAGKPFISCLPSSKLKLSSHNLSLKAGAQKLNVEWPLSYTDKLCIHKSKSEWPGLITHFVVWEKRLITRKHPAGKNNFIVGKGGGGINLESLGTRIV